MIFVYIYIYIVTYCICNFIHNIFVYMSVGHSLCMEIWPEKELRLGVHKMGKSVHVVHNEGPAGIGQSLSQWGQTCQQQPASQSASQPCHHRGRLSCQNLVFERPRFQVTHPEWLENTQDGRGGRWLDNDVAGRGDRWKVRGWTVDGFLVISNYLGWHRGPIICFWNELEKMTCFLRIAQIRGL